MNTLRQAAQAVLNAWNDGEGMFEFSLVIEDLDKALEQPEQKPVAWMVKLGDVTCFQHHADSKHASVPLYTTPPQRKPLTMDEIGQAWAVADGEHNASASVKRRITGAIEAAHGIKENT
jgi:hypothetical protein